MQNVTATPMAFNRLAQADDYGFVREVTTPRISAKEATDGLEATMFQRSKEAVLGVPDPQAARTSAGEGATVSNTETLRRLPPVEAEGMMARVIALGRADRYATAMPDPVIVYSVYLWHSGDTTTRRAERGDQVLPASQDDNAKQNQQPAIGLGDI